MAWVKTFTVLIAAGLASTAWADNGLSEVESRFTQFHQAAQEASLKPEPEQGPFVARRYLQLFSNSFSPKSLSRTGDKDLSFLVRAAELAEAYSFSHSDLDQLKLALNELERRGVATDDDRLSLYKALVSLREFGEARELIKTHPTIKAEPIPSVSDISGEAVGATFYTVDTERFELRRQSAKVSTGTHLIIVSHPLCGFSRAAMDTFVSDPVLSTPIKRYAIWLAPVDRAVYFDDVQKWNRSHPETQVVIAHSRAEWPYITEWATPNFYLIRDGKLIGHMTGWPKDGSNRDELIALLRRGSLLP